MQSQGLALPPEPEVGPSATRVNTKESYVDPLGDIQTRVTQTNMGFKVDVEEVKDADALVPVPTDEGAVGPVKPADRPDHEVDDPLYLMALTIPRLFLKPLQVMWDAIVFGVFNQDFPLHLTETSKRAGNSDVYGFLEPQSIQRSEQSQFESESYIKNWMQNSKRDVYLGAYLNGSDNYLKGIINRSVFFFNTFALILLSNINILMFLVFNSALKGLDDTPQPKSKAGARWIVVKYFNDVKPLEAERLKALRIQWAQYYLKVRNQT
ncbi:hypothetical protein HKD37_01G001413 [Glycine soja]